jgi:hypothetical protein
MATSTTAAPVRQTARKAPTLTPLERLEAKVADYATLEERKRPLSEEVREIEGEQKALRTDIMDILHQYSEVLNGKRSLALEAGTLTLRASQKLVEDLTTFNQEALDAALKRFKVDAYELKFNATAVVKAAAVVKGLVEALKTCGCEVRNVDSLTITPAKAKGEAK